MFTDIPCMENLEQKSMMQHDGGRLEENSKPMQAAD